MNELRERVQDALEDDPRTRDAGIDIINENGVITLGGIVPERETSEAAEAITKHIHGVASVINEIQVRKDSDDDDPFDVAGTLDEGIIVK